MSMTIIHQPPRQPTALPQHLPKPAPAPKQQHESPGSVGRRSLGEVVCKGLDLGAGPGHPVQLIEQSREGLHRWLTPLLSRRTAQSSATSIG